MPLLKTFVFKVLRNAPASEHSLHMPKPVITFVFKKAMACSRAHELQTDPRQFWSRTGPKQIQACANSLICHMFFWHAQIEFSGNQSRCRFYWAEHQTLASKFLVRTKVSESKSLSRECNDLMPIGKALKHWPKLQLGLKKKPVSTPPRVFVVMWKCFCVFAGASCFCKRTGIRTCKMQLSDVRTCENVRVQSATEWTASVRTLTHVPRVQSAYITPVQTCDNVRVQSATDWTASVHTLTRVQTCDNVRVQRYAHWSN